MDSVIELLDELESIIDQSRAVPFSNKVTVNKEEIYEIISEIRLRLPNELKQSKWVIEERNKILIDAQKEADDIVKEAEERLGKMVDEDVITKRAYEQAAEIIENSKKTSKEMRIGAMEYADEVLALTEKRLKEMLESIHNENVKVEDFFNESLDIIFENRQELRGNKK